MRSFKSQHNGSRFTDCVYVSFVFAIPLGKLMVMRFSIMQTFGSTWLLRTASLLPLLAIPFLVSAGHDQYALYCLLLAVGLFNFSAASE